jgi:hypothetical protein
VWGATRAGFAGRDHRQRPGSVVGVIVVRQSAADTAPDINLDARARLAADTFDHVSRPFTLRFAPLRSRARSMWSRRCSWRHTGLRSEPQRCACCTTAASLCRPAVPRGIEWAARDPQPAHDGVRVGLQVGRIGGPLTTWTVTPTPGGTWSEEFWLPVDAGFVGLRGEADLERSIAALRIEAVDVEDLGVRTVTPQVLAAARFGEAVVLFPDERLYPESAGFWTAGGRASRLTLACRGCAAACCGCTADGSPIGCTETHGWSQDDLRANAGGGRPAPATGGVSSIRDRDRLRADRPRSRCGRATSASVTPALPAQETR